MIRLTLRRHVLLALVLAVFAMACGLLDTQPAFAKGKLIGVEGRLQSVDVARRTVTIRTSRGQNRVIVTNANTKIERNDRRATLAAFKIGDRVEAKYTSVDAPAAVKVEAVGP